MIPDPFTYPPEAHQRRHGPAGWQNYRRYRPWLRDEFSFRCVFCLVRELWSDPRRANPVDHFIPRALRPDLTNDYDNLLYVCPGCNSIKSDSLVPDPCQIPFGECLRVQPDGSIQALDPAGRGQMLIDELLLGNCSGRDASPRRPWEGSVNPDPNPDASARRPYLNSYAFRSSAIHRFSAPNR